MRIVCSRKHCDSGVIPDARPTVAARKLRADELLAALGFSAVPDSVGRLMKDSPSRVVFDQAWLAVVRSPRLP